MSTTTLERLTEIESDCEYAYYHEDGRYSVTYYAPDGSAGGVSVGPHQEDAGERLAEDVTLDEARTIIERRLAGHIDPDDARWGGLSEHGDIEAYHESADEGCGGYAIRTGDGAGGSLLVMSDSGNTLLPPHSAERWNVLEEVESREDAVDAARAWEEAR